MKRLLLLLSMIVCFSLYSCDKENKDIITSKYDQIQSKNEESKQVNIVLKDVEFLELNLLNNNTRLLKLDVIDMNNEYKMGKVFVMNNKALGKGIYAIENKENPEDYLIIAENREMGTRECFKMIYKLDKDGLYEASICSNNGVKLFTIKYDIESSSYRVVYANNTISSLRASSFAWGCGLSLGAVGGMWGTVVGMACPVAGLAVGLAYTAFSIWACDESKIKKR